MLNRGSNVRETDDVNEKDDCVSGELFQDAVFCEIMTYL